MDTAINNIFTAYCLKGEWYSKFVQIDETFLAAFRNLPDLQDMFFGLLLGRSHCAFRGGCMMAMGGHTVEAYMLLRGCIEAALYALHMDCHPKHVDVWLNRHNDETSAAACKTNFSYGAVKRTLKVKSEKHYHIMSKLYEMTIDLGGHPNERSITGNLTLSKEGNKEIFHLRHIVGDSIQMDHALKTTSQVGVCALRILQLARPQYFELLGIDSVIDEVAKGI